jgi:amicyanin
MKKLFALVALLILVACVPQRFMAPPAAVPVPAVVPVAIPEPVVVPVQTEPVQSEPAQTEPAQAQQSEQAPVGSTVEIKIENFAYSPAEIKIKVGDTVVWTNMDDVPHTATSTDLSGDRFDSGLLRKGQSFSYTFKTAGTFSYKCTPHPKMRGKVIVE